MNIAIAQEWKELKGSHFIVYFTQDKNFASDVLRKAEKDYDRIASDLGYARYSNFWTWSNRVKIYIHPDHASYLRAANQPEWSEGMADYLTKEILSYSGSSDFLNSVLPHEIAHLIFRDFVGFKGEVPLWLDEGVAQWEEQVNRDWIKMVMSENLKKKALLSLEDMMDLDVRLVKQSDKLHLRTTCIDGKHGFLILDGDNLVNLYYLQAASLVGFLIEQYGTDKFTNFCRELRDGKNLEGALRSVYTTGISSIEELEGKWVQYLKEE
ncbi:MAG: hypothetical protein PVI33_01925 [Candidatus Omnitrophota bacterium]